MEIEKILQQLKELKPTLIARYKVKDIGLFGSWVRGEQKPDSDLDLLVDFEDEADLFDLVGLGLYLEERLGCIVDVIPRRSLRQDLRQTVLREVVAV